jgi:streptomycin 6-kinase
MADRASSPSRRPIQISDLPDFPDQLARAIRFGRGEADGAAWLAQLPRRLVHYLRRWELTPLAVAEGGVRSCCLYCTRADGRECVLKIPYQAGAGRLEARSLGRWNLSGATPAVLEVSRSSGVFLMARIRPGEIAVLAGDPADTQRVCELLSRLAWSGLPAMPGAPALTGILERRLMMAERRIAAGDDVMIEAWLPGALKRLEELMSNAPRTVIHGDLQAKNILLGPEGRWQTIDPYTRRGDVHADAALWAVVQDNHSTIAERIEQLVDGGLRYGVDLDAARLSGWCHVLGVLEYRGKWPGIAGRIEEFLAGPR